MKRVVGSGTRPKGVAPKSRQSKQKRTPSKRRSLLGPKAIAEVFARLSAANPAPKSELEYTNPYTLLVAVALSAQATDAGVNKATRALFKIADTPQKMVDLGEDHLRDQIKTIGLFRNKARNVIALSQKLVAEHGGKVPRDRDALESLPGVGRKTANVVLNVPSASRPWPSTRTSSALPTGSVYRTARRRWPWRRTSCGSFRPNTRFMPITG